MVKSTDPIEVYLETGKKRVFAGAIEWPGWCRNGREEEAALGALLEYGPRYAKILRSTDLGFMAPTDVEALRVVERLEGTSTTDFGAPDIPPSGDARPVGEADLERFRALLQACWAAFDASVQAATGVELRKGPRGGGRDLDKIVQHVLGADHAYLSKLGWKVEMKEGADPGEGLRQTRQAILDGLEAAAKGKIPERGPRGSLHWKTRYFLRRSVWHVLDHAWEIEDRAEP
jgi:hypothetical protein